jgi:hypothetical protein
VDEDDQTVNPEKDEEGEGEATQMTICPAHPDHGQHILLFLLFERSIQEAAFPSFLKKISNLAIKSKESWQIS